MKAANESGETKWTRVLNGVVPTRVSAVATRRMLVLSRDLYTTGIQRTTRCEWEVDRKGTVGAEVKLSDGEEHHARTK